MSEEITIQVPVNGTGPVDVTMQDPPAGPFLVEIMSIEKKTKPENGKTSLEFSVAIAEGEAQGITTRIWIGTDWSKKFNVAHFVNLYTGILEKLGKTPDEIKGKLQGVVTAPLAQFVGKKCFVLVKAAPDELDEQGRRQFADKNFITSAQYEAVKKAAALGGQIAKTQTKTATGTASATAGMGTPSAPPVPGATQNGTTTPPPIPQPGAGAAIGDLFT